MLKKLFAVLLSVLLVLAMFSACGGSEEDSSQDIESAKPADPYTDPNIKIHKDVQFMGSFEEYSYDIAMDGFTYRSDDNKAGIKSFDGSYDSGAKYVKADEMNGCFMIREKEASDPNQIENINSVGLVDAWGKGIIPAQYARIEALSERFYQVYKASAVAEDQETVCVTVEVNSEDVLYAGRWSVFDTKTGQEVPGVSGTVDTSVYAYGELLEYYLNGEGYYKNAAGQDIPEYAEILENGTYYDEDAAAVFDAAGNKLFDVDVDGYIPDEWSGGYYLLRKFENNSYVYVLADEKGNICSADIPAVSEVVEGGIIKTKTGLCDLQGNVLFDKAATTVKYYKGYWLIEDAEDHVYMMDSNYTVRQIDQAGDGYSVYTFYFAVTKKENNVEYYYSWSRDAFVEGSSTEWGLVVKKLEDGNNALVDIVTDEVILSGYEYYYVESTEDHVRFITAETADFQQHIYILK